MKRNEFIREIPKALGTPDVVTIGQGYVVCASRKCENLEQNQTDQIEI